MKEYDGDPIGFSLRNLSVLGVSAVSLSVRQAHRRAAEIAEEAQRISI